VGRRDLLDDASIDAGLEGLRWERDGAAITARVKLATFPDAIAFVGRVAEIAESMSHHPDIDIRWRTVILRVSTHDAGGLTQVDLDFARRVDDLPTSASIA
jgi:4a-hydroxytetrahydrobiopterin dehydratase